MTYNSEGTIKTILKVLTFDSGFKKQEVVITSQDDRFPQDIKFEFLKDSVDKLKPFKNGDNVKIAFELRGNEYNGKFYTNLVGIAIAKIDTNGDIKPPKIEDIVTNIDESDDDLPF